MSTIYKINRLCKINTKNPTPCKYNMDSDEEEYDGIFCDEQHVFCIKINIGNEEPIYAWVYNKHNGFYCHSVYYTNNTLKVDCWEQDCL